MRTLLHHGIVVTPEGTALQHVLVEDERIAEGMPSFKFFTGYPRRLMLDDGAIVRALR